MPSHGNLRVRHAAAACVAAAALALSACGGPDVTSGTDPIANASPVVTPPKPVGRTGCDPPSPATALQLGLEVQGTISSREEELWALFETSDVVRAGQPTTVWWRVPGDHALRLTLVGPGERLVSVSGARPGPLQGWDRPGEPWVSELTFPQPGCWMVHMQRGGRRGDLWIQVS